jgi:hypothetical protein
MHYVRYLVRRRARSQPAFPEFGGASGGDRPSSHGGAGGRGEAGGVSPGALRKVRWLRSWCHVEFAVPFAKANLR